MLTYLRITNFALLDDVEISLGPGMTVLTGETGAGKSILLDALGLALGARGDSSLVRSGAEKGVVTAAFALPRSHAAFAILAARSRRVKSKPTICTIWSRRPGRSPYWGGWWNWPARTPRPG